MTINRKIITIHTHLEANKNPIKTIDFDFGNVSSPPLMVFRQLNSAKCL